MCFINLRNEELFLTSLMTFIMLAPKRNQTIFSKNPSPCPRISNDPSLDLTLNVRILKQGQFGDHLHNDLKSELYLIFYRELL